MPAEPVDVRDSHRLADTLNVLRGNILVLTITQALGMFCRSMAFPYTSLYILALGGTAEKIGLINAISPLAGLLVFPLAGHLTDRTGRVRLIALAGYISAAITLLYVFARGWQAIALARLLQGFMVFQFPASSAIIADSLSPDNRGRGIAAMSTIGSAVAIVAPYLAGTLLDARGIETGMRILYGVMVAYSLLSATIHLRYLQETSDPDEHAGVMQDPLSLIRDVYVGIPSTLRKLPRSLKALAGVLALGFVANGIAGSFWVVYAQEQIGLSSSQWGLILLIETLLRCLMYIPAGVAVDRWGRTRCIVASLLLSLIAIPGFVFVAGLIPALLIRVGIAAATAFFVTGCTALMADLVPREARGRVMAALGRGSVMLGAASGGTGGPGVGFVITVPLMLASLSGGYLYQMHPAAPWFAVGVTSALSLALVLLFVRDPQVAEA
jgi:MFS family permease